MRCVLLIVVMLLLTGAASASEPGAWVLWVQWTAFPSKLAGDQKPQHYAHAAARYTGDGDTDCVASARAGGLRYVVTTNLLRHGLD
jgi:hypothetical protein